MHILPIRSHQVDLEHTGSRPGGCNLDEDILPLPDALRLLVDLLADAPQIELEFVQATEEAADFEVGGLGQAIGGLEVERVDSFAQFEREAEQGKRVGGGVTSHSGALSSQRRVGEKWRWRGRR